MREMARIARFGAVGLTSALLYFVTLLSLESLIHSTLFLTAVCYIASAIANYILQSKLTFEQRWQERRFVPRFIFMHIVCMSFNSFLMWIGHDLMRISLVPAQIMVTGFVAVLSYLMASRWVFV
jgi:putative flippase GtrA